MSYSSDNHQSKDGSERALGVVSGVCARGFVIGVESERLALDAVRD